MNEYEENLMLYYTIHGKIGLYRVLVYTIIANVVGYGIITNLKPRIHIYLAFRRRRKSYLYITSTVKQYFYHSRLNATVQVDI